MHCSRGRKISTHIYTYLNTHRLHAVAHLFIQIIIRRWFNALERKKAASFSPSNFVISSDVKVGLYTNSNLHVYMNPAAHIRLIVIEP